MKTIILNNVSIVRRQLSQHLGERLQPKIIPTSTVRKLIYYNKDNHLRLRINVARTAIGNR